MTISQGFLTYDAEGTEGGRYMSRILHVPSATSGLTIGRGYDMKEKSAQKIAADLTAAGVDEELATLISQASGLCGDEARAFISENDLADFEISMQTQEDLFNTTYQAMAKDVQRICNKADCVAAYGAVDWDELDPKIRDILVDLRYRGDYTPASRRRIQHFVSENDLPSLASDLAERDNWANVVAACRRCNAHKIGLSDAGILLRVDHCMAC